MPKFRISEAAEAAGKSIATRVKDKKTGASELIIFDRKVPEHEVSGDAAVRLRECFTRPSFYVGELKYPLLIEVLAEKPAPAAPGGAPGPA